MKNVLLTAAVSGAAMLAVPAGAVAISVSGTTSADGDTTASYSDDTQPASSGGAYDDFGNSSTAYSDIGGTLRVNADPLAGEVVLMSLRSGDSSFVSLDDPSRVAAEARATWSDTVTNTTGTSARYIYDFYIANPRVSNSESSGHEAYLSIGISLNGSSVYAASASMVDCVLTTSNIAMTTDPYASCSAYGSSYTTSIDLGVYAPGESFTIDYLMDASAAGPYSGLGGVPTTLMSSSSLVAETFGYGTFAAVGDPIDPTIVPIVVTVRAVDVPAPAALGLLGLGLGVLGLRRRR